MRLGIANTSPEPRQHWTSRFLTIPAAAGLPEESTFRADGGGAWRAVVGETTGGSAVVRVFIGLEGDEMVFGELVGEPHPDAGPFIAHRWVTDDLSELVPSARYLLPGETAETLVSQEVQPWRRVEESPAHELWHGRWRSKHGVIFDWWAEFLSDDPVAQVWGSLAWSDPNDPAHAKAFRHFVVSAGEQIAFDWRQRLGNPVPNREGHRWGHMVARNLSLADAQAFPLSGAMLCWASPRAAEVALEDSWDAILGDRADLEAGRGGPVVGVCLDWEGLWGPTGNLPPLAAGVAHGAPRAAWDAFLRAESVHVGYGAVREMGLTATPGQTGAQEDFGAAKGTDAVVLGDPTWIRRAQWAMGAELLRGYHYHEADGTDLRVSRHPNWTTYAGRTFQNLSTDRLGKDFAVFPRGGTGWGPADEEHISFNNLAAYLSLAHDPALLAHVRHVVTVLEADARTKGVGLGAARAQGRTLGAMAQLWTVSPPELRGRIHAVILRRLQAIMANPALRDHGVLEWRGPDPRKPVFTDSSRTAYAPWWSVWEHGLAAVGLKQCVDATGLGGDVLARVAESLARYGFRQVDSTSWLTTADMAWVDGPGVPGWPSNPADWQVTYEGGVGLWTRAGVLVAREVLGPDHPLAAMMDAYVEATGGRESTDRLQAEWAAATSEKH